MVSGILWEDILIVQLPVQWSMMGKFSTGFGEIFFTVLLSLPLFKRTYFLLPF